MNSNSADASLGDASMVSATTQAPIERIEPRDARGPRLVAQKPLHAFSGESFLPAPNAGLRCAGLPHDWARAGSLGAEQNDLRPPDMLLRRVAISDQRWEPTNDDILDSFPPFVYTSDRWLLRTPPSRIPPNAYSSSAPDNNRRAANRG